MSSAWKKLGRKLSTSDVRKGATDGVQQARRSAQWSPSSPPIFENLGQEESMEERLQRGDTTLITTIRDLERTISEQRRTIERIQEGDQVQQAQNWSLVDQFNIVKAKADELHGRITAQDETIRNLKWQLQAETARVGSLKAACNEKEQQLAAISSTMNEKDEELSSRSSTIRVLSEHNQQLQSRVTGLENILRMASRKTGHDLQSSLDRYTLSETVQNDMNLKLKESEEKLKASEERLSASVETQKNLHEALQLIESESATLRTVIDELQKDLSGLEVCQPSTLRSLLMIRCIEQASAEPETNSRVQPWVPTGLSPSQLDKMCTSEEIQELAKLLPKGQAFNNFYERLKLNVCSVCSKARISIRLDPHPMHQRLKWLDEYLGASRYFTCCEDKVCKDCFKKHVLETLQSKWWNRLGTLQWFMCPRAGCEEALGIRCEADLQICLERNLGIPADDYVKMYVKALAFRQALKALETTPDEETLNKASRMTQSLVAANLMYSPFDTRFDSTIADETGCIPDFQTGTIFHASLDNSTSLVPLFHKFFRRQARPKECMACSKSMFEIDYGSVEAWNTACKDFKGSWMWSLLLFPTSEIQQCDHEFEVCRACTAEHIRNTLVSGGPSACGNLTCPQCNRKLTHQEILRLADTETVAKYEKFLLQTFLSKEPNFRWCLNPMCTNGEQYEISPRQPKISCSECDFETCFTHLIPWHAGLTCAEYDSQREHGDPSFAATQEWITTNTKPCPNASCGTQIQKGEACFHMTCSQCSYEFCWQCLASWANIRSQGQQGHYEGCFFRTNNVAPTSVRGENLEAALGARGRG